MDHLSVAGFGFGMLLGIPLHALKNRFRRKSRPSKLYKVALQSMHTYPVPKIAAWGAELMERLRETKGESVAMQVLTIFLHSDSPQAGMDAAIAYIDHIIEQEEARL